MKKGSSNNTSYSYSKFDEALKKAAGKTGPENGFTAYQSAEERLAEDMPSIPLWYASTTGGYSDRVSDVRVHAFGRYDLSAITLKD